MPRKLIRAPAMPDDPKERTEELKRFVRCLAELIDHEYLDVYESVFFERVQEFMSRVAFEEKPEIGVLGNEILNTKSTKCRDFLKFFQAIISFINS